MGLSEGELKAAASLRELGMGDRKIASALDVAYGQVRAAREKGLEPTLASLDNFLTTVIVSDMQEPWSHPQGKELCQRFVADINPDQVINIGDWADLFSLARFRKGLSMEERVRLSGSLQQEVELMRKELSEWAALSDSKRIWLEGNHEARLNRYTEDGAPELFGLDTLTPESVFQTEARGWDYVSPYGAGVWVGNEGGLWATHGDYARKYSGYTAKAHLDTYGQSVIHGHTHRLGAYFFTGANGSTSGYEVGTLACRDATPRATQVVNWQLGFAVVYTAKEGTAFNVNLINIEKDNQGKHGFVYGGVEWRT